MKNLLLILLVFTFVLSYAQDDQEKEKRKKGFSMGGIPIVSFGKDTGLQYGAALNFFHYGDGSNYPNYNHSLFLQWSRTTKGGEANLLSYDAPELFLKTRMSFILGYFTEQTLNFYGFNGYQSYYNADYETTGSNDYISRMYYRHARKLFVSTIDFQGKTNIKNIKWLAGMSYFNFKIESVDIDKLNEGQETDLLPDTDLLYDKYISWNVIPQEEATGGVINYLKLGAIYDTRDNEANPNKGFWSEAILITAPGFSNKQAFTKLLLTHRQYITLLPEKLTFAYRLSYQPKISGNIPFYMLPFVTDSKNTVEGLGGAKTLRGVSRNRVVGEGIALANVELRSKFLQKVIFNQNFYLGVNLFSDMGVVTQAYPFNYISPNNDLDEDNINKNTLNYKDENIHLTYGVGLYAVVNSNFVIAMDYGQVTKATDGTGGLYISLNYIF
jgi:hypothetical protein